MPKLWTDTVATHREEVRHAVLDAAGKLVTRQGLLAVSMSQVAAAAGIGRATLYKYFADVEEVLAAWHARQVSAHLAALAADVQQHFVQRAGRDVVDLPRVFGAGGEGQEQTGQRHQGKGSKRCTVEWAHVGSPQGNS